LDAKHILALSTPFAEEPPQHTIADDCIEGIQDIVVCPLLEQEFVSTMRPSNRAHRIQQLAESPFTLLAKAEAVTSAASLLEAIQGFCMCMGSLSCCCQPPQHFDWQHWTSHHGIGTGNTGPLIMELELVFTH